MRPWNKGKKLGKQSKEFIQKRVDARKGYIHSKETIEKIRISNTGKKRKNPAWNKGVKTGIKPWLGKKRPNVSGENSYNWRGGEKTRLLRSRISDKKRYQKRKIEMLKKSSEWAKKNPEKIKTIMRKYRQNHKDKVNDRTRLRRAMIRSNGGKITMNQWEGLKMLFENKCAICKKEKKLTIDHIKPVSKGGTSNPDNIQPLCMECNIRKNNKFYPEVNIQTPIKYLIT